MYKFVFIIFIISVYIILSFFLDTGYVRDKFPLNGKLYLFKYFALIKKILWPWLFSEINNWQINLVKKDENLYLLWYITCRILK